VATTSLGLPYPANTDQPAGPSQMQALAEATDGVFLARTYPQAAHRVIRADQAAKFTVAAGGASDRLATSFAGTPTAIGDIVYGGGIYTLGTAGLYLLSTHTVWPGSTGSSTYSRLVGFYVNGARPANTEGADSRTVAPGEGSRNFLVTVPMDLHAGDTVQVFLAQSGPASEDVLVTSFTAARLA
jgi:hypothetical protein